jgi:creatinine amidohydrolase
MVPVGGVSPHGAHLPTGTDSIVAEAICQEAARRANLLVLPTISVACDTGAEGVRAGALSVGTDPLAQLLCHYAGMAAESGFRRLIFVSGNAANDPALDAATETLRRLRPELGVVVIDWWTLITDVVQRYCPDGLADHSGLAETAVMLAIAPELVNLDRYDPNRRVTAEQGRKFMDLSAGKLAKRAVRPPAGVRSHHLRSVVSTLGRRGL